VVNLPYIRGAIPATVKTYLRLLAFARPLRSYLVPYIALVLPAVVFGAVNFTLIIPLLNVLFNTYDVHPVSMPAFSLSIAYLKDVFNYWFAYFAGTYGKMAALQFVCAVIVISVFIANFFRYFSQRVLARMRVWVVYRMRRAVFEKITALDIGYFTRRQKGDLISVLSNDVQEVENSIVSTMQVILREPFLIVIYFVLLFIMSVKLTLFTLVFFPVSGYIIATISKKLKRTADANQQVLGQILSAVEETISGMRIIKGFVARAFVNRRFDRLNARYRQTSKSFINRREMASPVSEFLGVTVVVILIVYGGMLVLDSRSELSASQFITYIILYSQILPPAKNISNSVTNIQKGLAAGERVLQLVDLEPQVTDRPGAVDVSSFNDRIEYRNVSFAYEREPVLTGISFVLPKGRTLALVGQSGSGKSTLADLLPRFYDIGEGEILLDGTNLAGIRLDSLRGLMGIVTQEAILFNGSVFNNIAFGMEQATEEEVVQAATIANAHAFIEQMPQGYRTNIGDRGSKLSGGQRQRLSIARAVLRNPPILILDEATSALDTESERLVQEALFNLMKNRTTLVIAHRLSTIRHADEILVLEKGRIVERGNHEDLLRIDGVYRKLYDLQRFV